MSVAVVTQTLVILAKRGGGNSDTVVVLVALRRNRLIEVEGNRAQASQIGQRPLYTPAAPSDAVRSCAECRLILAEKLRPCDRNSPGRWSHQFIDRHPV